MSKTRGFSNLTLANGKSPGGDCPFGLKPNWSGKHPQTGAGWELYSGDAKEILLYLPKNFYTSVITSPPYFWQRDYGVAGQIGLEHRVDDYVVAIQAVMDGIKEVLHPKGVLFLNLGDTYYSGKGHPKGKDRKHNGRRFLTVRAVDKSGLGYPKKTLLGIPWRVALAMIDRGWILRSSIVWRRENAIPEPNVKDRPHRTFEHIFLFTKSRWYEFDRGPLEQFRVEDVWTIESQSQQGREHPAVFPPELVRRCLAVGNPTGGPVLDPFAGSGTVLRIAGEMKMDSAGIELNGEYCLSMARGLLAGFEGK